MVLFDSTLLLFIAKITLAMILGLLLGLERIYAHKTVGLRTYALASAATCFFVTISLYIGANVAISGDSFSPAQIAAAVITGIGFLGAGLIFFKDDHVQNLTTAAGLWMCAGIGMAVGFGMWREAIFATILTFFVLGVLSTVERYIRLNFFPDPKFESKEKIETVKKPVKTVRRTKKPE
jgi:putative Mg2+ transporter-C (MgtC) family protein